MSYKSVLIKVGIFFIGGGLGFFAGKKVYEGYYAKIAQEEIDSVKERFFDGRIERIKERSDNGMTDEEYEKRKEERKSRSNGALVRSSLDDNANERAKRNYNLVGVKPGEPKEEDDEEEDGPPTDAAGKTEKEMAASIDVDRTQPYIIDDREFNDEFDQHDKISLYYYRVDDVLCDENDEIIDDIEGTVGYDALSALDTQTTVWVRNEPLCIDYEIVSINKSYEDNVNGTNIAPAKIRESSGAICGSTETEE